MRSSRNTYRQRGTPGMICEQSLMETVRSISCLSGAEIQVLAEKSVGQLNEFLQSNNVDQVPNLEQNLGIAYRVLHQNVTRNSDYGGILGSAFLRHTPSPMLIAARGFKTKRSNSTVDKPFTNLNRTSSDDAAGEHTAGVNEILKHLDIPAKEKEKLNIALLSYAAGLPGNRDYFDRIDEVLKHLDIPDSEKLKINVALLSYAAGASRGVNTGEASGSDSKSEEKKKFWDYIKNFKTSLVTIGYCLIIGYLLYSLAIRNGVSFGSNRNEVAPENIKVTFDDVKGCDEAKNELIEVVDFLTNPEKFSNLGGKLPRGVLLVGPPGTGKTLMAKAVAGEAGVPFFHASGSEFDEILVGQGAKRVRDLFKAAKARAPCVLFIDEIDSVGGKRGRDSGGLHPYASQTINQLLSEMDGFMSNEGVIVLGATNRVDVLDPAILRPGRFDTQVQVPNPDIKGRIEILKLYLSKIKHDNSVNVEKLAKLTRGFSGADLFNMVNISAIRAAVDGKEFVSMAEFEESHDKIVLGTDWKSRVRDKVDLEITAYHEAGHTLVAYLTPDTTPLHKVTIVAKGASGGHTAFIPENDADFRTKAQYIASMDVSMGGRAAEELIFGKEKITGGASSDLQNATKTSEHMVKKLGMSEKIGLRVIGDERNDTVSPGAIELMDIEINKQLNESYKRAMTLLKANRAELELLAEALLLYETLDYDDIRSIVEHKRPPTKILIEKTSKKLTKLPSQPITPGIPVPGLVPGPPAGGEVVS